MSDINRSSTHYRSLPVLYSVIATYGIVFGIPVFVAGFFIGWHIILPAACHVVLGVGFAISAFGVAMSNPMAYRIGSVLSVFVTLTALIAVIYATINRDLVSVFLWGSVSLFFTIVTWVTVKARKSILSVSSMQTNNCA